MKPFLERFTGSEKVRLKKFFLQLKSFAHSLRSNKLWQPLAIALAIILISTIFNFTEIAHDQRIILIPGESFSATNSKVVIQQNDVLHQGKSFELVTNRLPKNSEYFYFLYEFYALEAGNYWILIAGTPPGAILGRKNEWFSPYWISFDDGEFVHVTAESVMENFPEHPELDEYFEGGYYWTRIGSAKLTPGKHTLEIRINEQRKRDSSYAMYIDSILIVPKGWKPIRLFKNLPPEILKEG